VNLCSTAGYREYRSAAIHTRATHGRPSFTSPNLRFSLHSRDRIPMAGQTPPADAGPVPSKDFKKTCPAIVFRNPRPRFAGFGLNADIWRVAVGRPSHHGLKVSKKGADSRIPKRTSAQVLGKALAMPDVTVVFWRDIPAQVIVGKGRHGAKAALPERFEQAIDRAAMKAGVTGTDDYLNAFRKASAYPVEGNQDEVAITEASRIDTEYGPKRLKALVEKDGWA